MGWLLLRLEEGRIERCGGVDCLKEGFWESILEAGCYGHERNRTPRPGGPGLLEDITDVHDPLTGNSE